MNNRFALDRRNAKWLGVCAGIARKADVDVTGIRLVAVLTTLFLLGPVTLLLYIIAAMVSDNG